MTKIIKLNEINEQKILSRNLPVVNKIEESEFRARLVLEFLLYYNLYAALFAQLGEHNNVAQNFRFFCFTLPVIYNDF